MAGVPGKLAASGAFNDPELSRARLTVNGLIYTLPISPRIRRSVGFVVGAKHDAT